MPRIARPAIATYFMVLTSFRSWDARAHEARAGASRCRDGPSPLDEHVTAQHGADAVGERAEPRRSADRDDVARVEMVRRVEHLHAEIEGQMTNRHRFVRQ